MATVFNENYRDDLTADRGLKEKMAAFLRPNLLPLPRPGGRPQNVLVSRAIRVLGELRRENPQAKDRELWACVYRLIPGYDGMADVQRRDARAVLRDRVRWRRRARKRARAKAKGAAPEQENSIR